MAYPYSSTYGAGSFLTFLESYNLTEVILPFFLVFLIVFAILQKTNILGQHHKNFNAMFALILSLMVVMPHVLGKYPEGADLVVIMNSALPNISVVAIAIMMVLLLTGIVAPNFVHNLGGIIAFISFAAVVYFFGSAADWWPSFYTNWWGPDTTSLVIVILVFAIVLWFILREPGQGEALSKVGKGLESFNKLLGGGRGDH
ncbi:hypothetical protein HYY69_02500 [Candidatus Woesearchaeota archaeon]|nr:hypothetical protein [Candidatus Woesearchaeota archaeon]